MLLAEVPDQEMLATPNTKEWGGAVRFPVGCAARPVHTHMWGHRVRELPTPPSNFAFEQSSFFL